MQEYRELFCAVIEESIDSIRKIVLSKAFDKSIIRCEARPVMIGGERRFIIETFDRGGKAVQKNISDKELVLLICRMAFEEYRQTNIITSDGECSLMISKKKKIALINNINKNAPAIKAEEHNRKKNYIIDVSEHADFLSALGICDKQGRIYDKKQPKYRQINRFVELLLDIYPSLPKQGQLTVCDLCCGKSYLTFAIYYFLTKLKGRQIQMFGVDLKADVVEYCTNVARDLGCEGLSFICADISAFKSERAPDLVVSLHACDTATDVVLSYAIKNRAKVVMSTPCCHHEMNRTMKCSSLSFIERHSILKQKLCDAATDALRALRLESEGYEVEVMELIDPEETPKNVMIRAVKSERIRPGKTQAALEEYNRACNLLGVSPTLDKLLRDGQPS